MKSFLLFSRKKQIFLTVWLFHCLLLFVFLCGHLISSFRRSKKPIVVKTYTIEVPKQAPSKPLTAAAVPTKKTAQKKATPIAKEKKEKKVVPEILPSPPIKKRSELIIPSRIEPKVEPLPQEEPSSFSYEEFLIPYLQNALDLPEYGEVRAEITIDRFGQVIDFVILSAKSIENGEFLKREVPKLSFPPLESSRKFTITFRNR